MKKIKKRGKKLEEQIKKISALAGMVLLEGMMRLSVYAAEPQFVTGTKNLVADMTKYLLGAVAAVTGALLIKNGYQWNMAGEEEKPKHKKTFGILHHLKLGDKQIQIIMDRYDTVLSTDDKYQSCKNKKPCCQHQIPI